MPLPTDIASIPSSYTRLIGRALGLNAKTLPQLLQDTGLTPDQLLANKTQLTAKQQIQILDNALRITDDPCFALKLGSQLTLSTHGAMGYLANSSPNLRTALEAIRDYLPTQMNLIQIELRPEQDSLLCICQIQATLSEELHRWLVEACVMVFFACAEFILGRPADSASIAFSFAKPAHASRYAQFFPAKVSFDQGHDAVSVPLALCEIDNVAANDDSYQLARAQCDAIMAQLASGIESYRREVVNLLLSKPGKMLTEDDAAAALFISKRTLARRLKSEGTHFREVRDDILSRQAVGFLKDEKLTVDAIAALLNYHDSANFRRAFKRWFQMTPDQFRRQANAS